MADWLAGFDYSPANRAGNSYAVDVADKLVLHTTEGNSIDGAVGAYTRAGSWPHFTVDPLRGAKVQHLPINRAAFALFNYSSTAMETNRAGDVIQVEIVGFAGSTHTYSEAWYRWLALEVVRPICLAAEIPARCTKFYGSMHGTIASEHWAGRMEMAEFYGYSGICGHQNVGDGNDHWDPGFLNAELLLRMAFGGGVIYDPVSNTSWEVGGGPMPTGGFETHIRRDGDDELDANQAAQLNAVAGVLTPVYPPFNRPVSLADIYDSAAKNFGQLHQGQAVTNSQLAAIAATLRSIDSKLGALAAVPSSGGVDAKTFIDELLTRLK
jgi:hypothetical protein